MANINGSFSNTLYFNQFFYGYVPPPTIIGTVSDCNNYLSSKMFADAWIESSLTDQLKALNEATLIICRLRIKYPQWIYDSYTVFPLVGNAAYTANYYPPIDPNNPGLPDPNTAYFTPPPPGYFNAYDWPPPPPNAPPGYWLAQPVGIPTGLKQGCYEIALGLLQGIDPNKELYNLTKLEVTAPGTRTTYQRTQIPDYIRAGVPTASAWSLIQPFLADANAIRTVRS